MKIHDQTAVITGGGGGIGEATARLLIERGAKTVVLVDRSERVREVAERLNGSVGRPAAAGIVGDVTSSDFRREAFSRIHADYGVPRICVPAAGITRDALSVKISKDTGVAECYPESTFREVLEVNLVAATYWPLEMIAGIANERRREGLGRWQPTEPIQGAVVFIGSVSSQGNRGQVAYAASKAAVEAVAATLSKEAIFHGVRCTVVHPGFTDTPMVRALGDERINRDVLPQTQLGRLIQPAEIAEAICFLIANPIISGPLWADAGWHPPA